MELNTFIEGAQVILVAVAWKVAGAFVLWLVGRWLIGLAIRMLGRALGRQQFDVTLTRYLQTGLGILLNIALIVAILGFFGSRRPPLPHSWRPAAWPSAWRGAACSPISPPVCFSSSCGLSRLVIS